MNQTIKLTPGSTKWIFLFNGLVNTALGVNQLLNNDPVKGWVLLLVIALVVAGPFMMVYAALLFSSTRLIPMVHINDIAIVVKEDIHHENKNILWEDIKEISFKSFEINFTLKGRKNTTVILNTNAQISQEIKRSIRAVAEKKDITINGG